MKYVCIKCKKEHPTDLVDKWGADGYGDGAGPSPVCTNLMLDRNQSGYVCRGQLVAVDGDIQPEA